MCPLSLVSSDLTTVNVVIFKIHSVLNPEF